MKPCVGLREREEKDRADRIGWDGMKRDDDDVDDDDGDEHQGRMAMHSLFSSDYAR